MRELGLVGPGPQGHHHDAYQLEYSDGHIDIISFNDVLKLLPKAWSNPQAHYAHIAVEPINEPLIMHVEAAALIAHITTDRAPKLTLLSSPRLRTTIMLSILNAPLTIESG